MRIVELTIDELQEFGGIEAISLVERPAHESNWLAFTELVDGNVYETLDEDKMSELAFAINELGEPYGKLEEEGYVLYRIEDATPMETFAVSSNPNPKGEEENIARIRYKYVGPKAERVFCKEMLRANRVFTQDDIEALSSFNPVGPTGYSVLHWRGSYNCRHKWVKLTYLPKGESGDIINKSSVRKGLISEQVGTLYDTRTTATINAGNTPEPRVGGFSVIDMIDEIPLFSTREEAELLAEKIGCKGHHTHKYGDNQIGYMPCETHEFQSYDDYPQAASENACKVLKWIEEYGREEVEGMELTGLRRANQLCKREKISEETIARMAAFERHRNNSEIAPEFKGTPWKDKGYSAWLGWGGSEGVEWAQRKLEQIRKEEFSSLEEDQEMVEGIIDILLQVRDENNRREMVSKVIDNLEKEGVIYDQVDLIKRVGFDLTEACWPGYEAIGTKELNGKVVPNCVPVKQSKEEMSCSCKPPKKDRKLLFSIDEEKMEITGAAVIPNKMIIRRAEQGDLYYVFFSEDTTRKLAEQFMKKMLLNKTNVEHSDKPADSYVKESWIVEDPEYDKSTAMGFSFPKGTWVVTMKVANSDIWKRIKQNKLNGFSIEGWFSENLLFS